MEELGVLKDSLSPINVRQFLLQWDPSVIPGIVHDADDDNTKDEIIATEMDVPLETVKELAAVCGAETLECGKVITDIQMLQNIPDDVDLVSVRLQKEELEKRATNPTYKIHQSRSMKYKFHDLEMENVYKELLMTPPDFQVVYPDVVLTVNIHSPNLKSTSLSYIRGSIDQTLLVLGCEKLTDLRDKISCANDLCIAGDRSENPDEIVTTYAKDLYKSGFFYIEGCFYNDMREPECRDYSREIREWAQEAKHGFGKFKTANMENTTFQDLTVRLGQPYVYLHQGDCEHLIIFSDVRLLHKDDIQDVREYPKLIRKRRQKRSKCRVCQIHSARWKTYNSEHAPENPCFFCEQCFKGLHYDENGEKLGNFQAYKYFDSSAMINV